MALSPVIIVALLALAGCVVGPYDAAPAHYQGGGDRGREGRGDEGHGRDRRDGSWNHDRDRDRERPGEDDRGSRGTSQDEPRRR